MKDNPLSLFNKDMKFCVLFSLLGISVASICQNDIYYINSEADLNQIADCNVINGSLYIHGEHNINSLSKLSNLNIITDNLVIIDSHSLRSLEGLQNLYSVDGNNLYLEQYSIVIKFNINETGRGLCYANTLNWTKITNHDVNMFSNGLECPDCHNECNGCWGDGPRLCQDCINYKYNNTCVPYCPSTYEGKICDNVLPSSPILDGFVTLDNNIYLNWTTSNNHDFINGYKLYLNNFAKDNVNTVIDYFTNLDYNQYPNNYFINGTLLDFDTIYLIKLEFINDIGTSEPTVIFLKTYPQLTTQTSTVTTTATTSPTTTDNTTPTSTETSTSTTTETTTPTSTPTNTKTTSATTSVTSTAKATSTTTLDTITKSTKPIITPTSLLITTHKVESNISSTLINNTNSVIDENITTKQVTTTIYTTTTTCTTISYNNGTYQNSDIDAKNILLIIVLIISGIILLSLIVVVIKVYRYKKKKKRIHPNKVSLGCSRIVCNNIYEGTNSTHMNPVYDSNSRSSSASTHSDSE